MPRDRSFDPSRAGDWLTWPRIIAWGSVAAMFTVVLWTSPASPVALWRADLALGLGDATEAVRRYEAIVQETPFRELRIAALWRCGAVWRSPLGDSMASRLCLQRIAQDVELPVQERARAWEAIAELLVGPMGLPEEAASAYRQAFDLAPDTDAARGRLVGAAQALVGAGKIEEAHEAWERVARRYPDLRAAARVAQGHLLLGMSKLNQAREAYREAIDSNPDEIVLSVATDGKMVCETRLERVQTALAAIQNDDLPADLRRRLEQGPAEPAEGAEQNPPP